MKIVVPATLVAVSCYLPFSVAGMMGYPVVMAVSSLPEKAELVAFYPHDEEGLVDLWLLCPPSPPRAYETKLTNDMKETLRRAREKMRDGQPAMLARRGKDASPKKGHPGDPLGIGDDQTTYVLDESAISTLPAKE